MATFRQWAGGARPSTLTAAVTPVLAGTAVAASRGVTNWGMAALCLLVALSMQIGVNYANDYSDGMRGTDADRVGPIRLVGSGIARPGAVKLGAFAAFGVAAVSGLVLVAFSGHWWLLTIGASAIAAGWFYTGGKRPYGYLGFGELGVFIFFGLVAVAGTVYVLLGEVPLEGWMAAAAIGALASAILVANNLRDLDKDAVAGKMTLATRLGDHATRAFYLVLVIVAFVLLTGMVMVMPPLILLTLLGAAPALPAALLVTGGAEQGTLIKVLKLTSLSELLAGAGLFAGVML